ncbi:hypothetical protein EST38_g9496 [Candolleomyces aberdarensis]|uniref:Fungal-type protein kinase domain-containing protein n=1 Tax=Candolleomyces aberdarensis TaxID=2316362 RepID=A0A4Q2DD12_9AGAR|nr:hypothetical protein EST38_g9496 [Candolleomyces aberdarensis]
MPPNFESRQASQQSRTGTYAFMSHRVLLDQVLHKAIHDGESIFYTLVYLAITRSGPGGARRDIFPGESMSSKAVKRLQRISIVRAWCFEGDGLGVRKLRLFHQSDDFKRYVLPYMNPYFQEPLQKLFLDLWDILVPAFYQDARKVRQEFPIPVFKRRLKRR